MKLLLYICMLFLLGFQVNAAEKCFKAYDSQNNEAQVLCVGQPYTFQDCGNEVPDENEYYIFDYKKGTPVTNASNDQTHTYTRPGRYRVLQIANYGNSTLTDTVSVVYEVKASPEPEFSYGTCANGVVEVRLKDTNYASVDIDFGDGRSNSNLNPNSTVQHVYTSPGTYQMKVTGRYGSGECNGIATRTVTARAATTGPLLSRLTVKQQAVAGRIELELNELQPGSVYLVQQWRTATATYATIDTIRTIQDASLTNALTHVMSNRNTTLGLYYRVKPLDACGSVLPASNVLSSLVLTATSGNNTARLQWRNMPFAQQMQVYRNGELIKTLPGGTSQFVDDSVVCNTTYRYMVQGIAANGSVSVSAAADVLVTSQEPPPAPTLLATYNAANQVEVQFVWEQQRTIAGTTLLERANGMDGKFSKLADTEDLAYTDALSSPGHFCYRATYSDACGNTSEPSEVSCPVFLQGRQQPDVMAVQLSWTEFEGAASLKPVQYTVEKMDENGTVYDRIPVTGTTYTDNADNEEQAVIHYRIVGTLPNGQVTYSNTITVELDLLLFVPSGFTPNGDGLNDVFDFKNRFIESYRLRVYNRLGTVVYEGTQNDSGWDGTYQGKQLPVGAYTYEIQAKSKTGKSRKKTGTITLLR